MNHDAALANAKEMADRLLMPAAQQNDKEGRFSVEAVAAFGPAGFPGLMLPEEVGGAALGPRTFAAVVATLAEADASVAMVYLMHICVAATIAAARAGASVAPTLKAIAARPAAAQHSDQLRQEARRESLPRDIQIDIGLHCQSFEQTCARFTARLSTLLILSASPPHL